MNSLTMRSRSDGVASIGFYVFKQQDANIVTTGEGIKLATEELRKSLPPGVELRLVYADSDWVKDSLTNTDVATVSNSVATGIIPGVSGAVRIGHWNGLRIVDGILTAAGGFVGSVGGQIH